MSAWEYPGGKGLQGTATDFIEAARKTLAIDIEMGTLTSWVSAFEKALEPTRMKPGVIERAREMVRNVTAPEYFLKIGQECIADLIGELEKDETALREENDKLKRLCRFQFMTLGYYGTHHNYDPKKIVYHPISGEAASGIMQDGGREARQAQFIARDLGFDGDEICAWPGPGVKSLWGDELESAYAAWFEKRTGKKIADDKISGPPGVPVVQLADAQAPRTDGPVRSL